MSAWTWTWSGAVAVVLCAGCCGRTPCTPTAAVSAVAPASAAQRVDQPAADGSPKSAPPKDAQPKDAPPEVDIQGVLARKQIRGLRWEAMTLTTATQYLQTITGVPFHISPKVMEEKHDDTAIDLELGKVSSLTVLGLITEPYGTRFEMREGAVWIRTLEETEGPLKLRYFDLADLIRPVGEHGFASDKDAVAEIERRVFPKFWKREDATLEVRRQILIARASESVLDGIQRVLEEERGRLHRPGLPDHLKQAFTQIRVTIAAEKLGVADAIDLLRQQTGRELMIDPRLRADLPTDAVPTSKLKDVSLLSALQWLAAQMGDGIVWVGRGGVAILTRVAFAR